eukprot:Pgem_evm1s19452
MHKNKKLKLKNENVVNDEAKTCPRCKRSNCQQVCSVSCIISNIPKNFKSADLRYYFSNLIEDE